MMVAAPPTERYRQIDPERVQLAPSRGTPTIFGLGPADLHDHFWAARGVHVVRRGGDCELSADAELFMLTDPRTFVMFRLRALVETISWAEPAVTYVRIRGVRHHGYQERVLSDFEDRFIRFKRIYGGSDSRLARVVLTRDRQIAREWQRAATTREAWQHLRARTRRARREVLVIKGHVYDSSCGTETARYVRDLVQFWVRPATSIKHVRKVQQSVWAHERATINPGSRFVGPVWVGAGRSTEDHPNVVGPAVLWDDPDARPAEREIQWGEIEPTEWQMRVVQKSRRRRSLYAGTKRLFDLAFATFVLLLTLPIYPVVMLAIWLEDGRPFFFGHRRETLGGKEFPCLKFRSMRKDADTIKAQLAGANQADGPQFFMERDPRLTRVGRIIRKLNVDELPQFLNVLVGHMSVVGPRPSPRSENQFCPAWREARLSVRPGVTGLWQVRRTRRRGCDFQEWIKFDLEYVDKAGWGADLKIILQTFSVLLRGSRSGKVPSP
jgi:lipopolysaccharide/colanic/teichoic acid biosynthesis glycosyltransferase